MNRFTKRIISTLTAVILTAAQIPCGLAKPEDTGELSAKEKYVQYLSENQGPDAERQIIVKLKDGGAETMNAAAFSAMQSSRQYSLVKTIETDNISILETDTNSLDAVLEELNQNEDVVYAQPDYKVVTAENGLNKNLWAIQNYGQTVDQSTGQNGFDANFAEAWEITKGAEDVVVAVIDTGIDIQHESLRNNIWVNPGETAGNNADDDQNGYADDLHGWDFVNDDSSVYDMDALDEHGTHMAGIIAGNGKVSGAAPNIRIMPLKALNYASGYTSDILEAIAYAKQNGAKIINCSFASIEYNPALEDAIASNPDILFVCAAGNYGRSTSELATFPACYDLDNILAVSAANNKGELSALSTYGEDIDIAAPGVGIYSTLPEGGYGYKDGTSCSAAYASGIAGLLLSHDPELSAAQIKEKIISSMTNALPVENNSAAEQAEGFVDAAAAIKYPIVKKQNDLFYTAETGEKTPFEKYPFVFSYVQGQVQIEFDKAKGFDSIDLKIFENTEEKLDSFPVNQAVSGDMPVGLPVLQPDTEYQFAIKTSKNNRNSEYLGILDYSAAGINWRVESAQQYELPVPKPEGVPVFQTLSDDNHESENNNTISLANELKNDYNMYGYIYPASDVDYYKIQFSEAGVANFWLGNIPVTCDYELELYDEAGNRLASSHKSESVQELIQFYPVEPGIEYFIKVYSFRGSSNTEPYTLRAKSYPLPDKYESNDAPKNATELRNQKRTIYANINHPEDIDYYKFTMSSKFLCKLNFLRPSADYRFEIFAESNLNQSIFYTAGTDCTKELNSGTYYIKVYTLSAYSEDNYTLNFECAPLFTIGTNQEMFDEVKDSGNVYYQLDVNGSIGIQIYLLEYEDSDFDLYLYDSNYQQIAESRSTGAAEQISESLQSGSYRIRVHRYQGTYNGFLVGTESTTVGDAASLVSSAFPTEMKANEVKTVKILATNNGANAWNASAGYKLGRLNESAEFISYDSALTASERIPYKKSKTFIFNITAPDTELSYVYTTGWRMKRNALYFGDTLKKNISVEPNLDSINLETLKSVSGKPSGIRYMFTAAGAGDYVFRTFKNITECDTKLTIYDAAMKRVASNDDMYGGNCYSRLEVNLKAGIYYIEISEFDNKPIYCHLLAEKYSFSEISGNQSATVSDQYEGYFVFDVAKTGTYIITTEYYARQCDTYLVLYKSQSTSTSERIAENDDSASSYSRIETELDRGTYYIRASNYDYQKKGLNKKTSCKLRITQPSSEAGDKTAAITISSPRDGSVVRAYEGASVKISGTTANVSGVTVKVNGAAVSGVKTSGSRFECSFLPGETGSYQITATGRPTYGGSSPTAVADVTIVVNDDGDDFETATAVKEGTERIAAIDYEEDIDCFMLSPRRDGMYSIHTRGGTDTIIEVFNGRYIPIGYNDDDNTERYGCNADVALYLAANQVYYIMVHHANQAGTGEYTLCIDTLTDDNTDQKVLTLNKPITGKIDYPEDEDVFSFTPAQTRTYTFYTTGNTDTMGVVYDSDGYFMDYNDDVGSNLNCSISVALTAGNTYYFAIKHNRTYMYGQQYSVAVS